MLFVKPLFICHVSCYMNFDFLALNLTGLTYSALTYIFSGVPKYLAIAISLV